MLGLLGKVLVVGGVVEVSGRSAWQAGCQQCHVLGLFIIVVQYAHVHAMMFVSNGISALLVGEYGVEL